MSCSSPHFLRDLAMVQALLGEAEAMRYQDPKIEKREDCPRPYWFIRPYVTVYTEAGAERKQKRIQLGWCDEMTVKQAKAAKEQHMALINDGRFLIQSQVPFETIVEKFKTARVPQLASSTQEKYQNHIRNHILPAFKGRRMCDIGRHDVEAWLVAKEQAGMSWATRCDLRNILAAIYSTAATWKLWDGENPAAGARVGRKTAVRPKRSIAAADLQRFLAAIKDTAIIDAEGARLIVTVALVAGLRVSEVLGLKRSDIDIARESLTVAQRWHRGDVDIPKTESSKRTRQIGSLAGQINAYLIVRGVDADGWCFARLDEPNPPDDRDLQQHVFRPAAEAVGIYRPGFGMHTFRALNVTWRQEAGATPLEAMKAAGHSQVNVTYLYTLTDEDRERAQAKAMIEKLGGESGQSRPQ